MVTGSVASATTRIIGGSPSQGSSRQHSTKPDAITPSTHSTSACTGLIGSHSPIAAGTRFRMKISGGLTSIRSA